MVPDLQLGEFLVGDTLADLVAAAGQNARDHQPLPSGRAVDVPHDRLEVVQRLARPIHRDEAEQAMLDGVPLRASAGVVAHRHFQAIRVGDLLLELLLPDPGATAVRPAGVSEDQ